MIDAWQLQTWEAYREERRLGRKTRLPEAHRKKLWTIFEKVRRHLTGQNLMTQADLFNTLAAHYATRLSPFDYIVVDEAQDIGVAQLRFLAALKGVVFRWRPGQRIFQQPFSWK